MPPNRWLRIGVIACLLLSAGCTSTAYSSFLPTPTAIPLPSPIPTPTRADETVIPFQTLATNDLASLSANVPGGEPKLQLANEPKETNPNLLVKPTVYLITRVNDLGPLEIWLPPDILKLLAQVDYTKNIVLVYRVGVSSGSSDTHIQRLATSQANELTVYVVYNSSNANTSDVTYPSQSIEVSRNDVPFTILTDTVVALVYP